MSLKYYPLTRILTNRYTRGNEFVLGNGKSYKGRYYTLFTGESFAGTNPVLGTGERLYNVNPGPVSVRGDANRSENARDPKNLALIAQYTGNTLPLDVVADSTAPLTELVPYFPFPIESDYQRGYFTRYFAKKLSGPGYIFEISKLDWTKIQNGEVEETALGYETADILWQLTGPLKDKRISQYQIQGGVFDTNKRVTEAEDKTFRGLVNFIGGNYTKFARITPE